ncbi:sugar phosphate isomerase/epimerase [bacterium]|nr:sugar phosphate isomerase/epimerase [bacterium]
MRLACGEMIIPGNTFREKVEFLESAGFDGIDLVGAGLRERVSEVKDVLTESSIGVTAIYSRLQYPLLSGDIEERKIAIEQLKDRLSVASELNALGVIFVPIFGPPKIQDLSPFMSAIELERALLISILKEIVPIANSLRVKLLLEPVNRKETHFINNLTQGFEIAKETGVYLLADIYHLVLEEQSPDTLAEYKDYIGYVHIANREREVPKEEDFVYLKPWLDTLKKIGYNGYISLECSPPKELEVLKNFVETFKRLAL